MYKEIVTKAIIGKGKKNFTNKYQAVASNKIDTVLGCWVINHNMKGIVELGKVKIDGSFDVNIWYSYENNTKTAVEVRNINYTELVNIRLRDSSTINTNSEIIISSVENPRVVDVNSKDNLINYIIEKTLGIEVIGEDKVRIQIMDNSKDDYDIIDEEIGNSDLNNIIDNEISEDYLM